jgi:hypothetical protein
MRQYLFITLGLIQSLSLLPVLFLIKLLLGMLFLVSFSVSCGFFAFAAQTFPAGIVISLVQRPVLPHKQ